MADRQELELLIKARQQTDAAFKAVLQNLANTEKAQKSSGDQSKLLSALTGELSTKMGGLAGSGGSVASVLTKMGPAGIVAAASVGAVVAAAYKLATWTADFAKSSGELVDVASQIRWSTTALQEWTFAAGEVGAGQEMITLTAGRLTRSLASGSDEVKVSLNEMGLSLRNLEGLAPEEQYARVIAGVRGMSDQNRAAAVAFQLLGDRSGKVLRMIRSDTDSARKAAKDYNAVTSGETLQAADNMGDQLEHVAIAWQRLKNSIVTGIATSPEAIKAIDDIAKGLGSMGVAVAKAGPDVVFVIGSWINAVRELAELMREVDGFFSKIGKAASGAVGGGRTAEYNKRFGGAAPTADYMDPNAQLAWQRDLYAQFPAMRPKTFSTGAPKPAAAGGEGGTTKPGGADELKAVTDAENALAKARLGMLPILDREHGALRAQIGSILLEADAKRRAIIEDKSLGEGKSALRSQMLALNDAQAGAQIAALKAADAQQRQDEQTQYASESARELVTAQAALGPAYRAATLAIEQEIAAKNEEIARTWALDPAERAVRQAKTETIGQLKLEAAARAEQSRLIIEENDAKSALAAAMAWTKSSYEAETDAIEDAYTALELKNNLDFAAGKVSGERADQLNKEARALSDAERKAVEFRHTTGGVVETLKQSTKAYMDETRGLAYLTGNREKAIQAVLTEMGAVEGDAEARKRAVKIVDQETEALKRAAFARSAYGKALAAVGMIADSTSALLDDLGVASERSKAVLGGVSQMSSGLTTMATGGPVGMVVGGMQVLGGAFKSLKGVFGKSEEEKVNDIRDTYTQAAGGIDALAQSAANAGTNLEKFYAAKTQDEFKAAIKDLTEAKQQLPKMREEAIKAAGGMEAFSKRAAEAGLSLNEMMQTDSMESFAIWLDYINSAIGKQDTAYKAVDDAAQRYGLTVDELGPKFQQQGLDQQVGQLLTDYTLLKESGAEMGAVNARMGESVNAYLANIRKTGAEIPENFRPALEAMLASGTLTDELGNKLTSLEGFNFGATLTESLKSVVDVLREMVDALRGIPPVAKAAADSVGSIQPGAVADSANKGTSPREYTDYAQAVPLADGGIITRSGVAKVDAGEVYLGAPGRNKSVGASIDYAAMGQAVAAALAASGLTVQVDGRVMGSIMADAARRNAGGLGTAMREVVG